MAHKGQASSNRTKSRQRAIKEPSINGTLASSSFVGQHLDSAMSSLLRMWQSPIQTLATLLGLGVTLSLPAVLYVLLQTGNFYSSGLDQSTDIAVYVAPQTSAEEVNQLQAQLLQRQEIAGVVYISPDDGLQEFVAYTGLSDIIEKMGENPLPAKFLLTIEPSQQLSLPSIVSQIQALVNVDQVVFDKTWLVRLQALLQMVESIFYLLVGLMLLAASLIVGNVVRLQAQERQKETYILQLVGATRSYIHRPLFYSALWLAFFGGLFGWLIANVSTVALVTPLQSLAAQYQSQWLFVYLGLKELIIMQFGVIFVALVVAWITALRVAKR